jgi:serine/threonine-protein kinase
LVLGFTSLERVPGSPYLLASVWDGVSIEDYAIVSVSLTDGSLRPVVRNALDARFVAPDRLVFFRESSLLASPFDPASGQVTGEAVQVVDGVRCGHWADDGQFAVSASGTLAYVAGGRQGPGRRLIRVDSNGKAEPLMDGVDALVGGLLVSPNGRDVAVITLRREVALWAFNLDRRNYTLINNVGESWSPVWTPDGAAMVFKQIVPGKEEVLVRKSSSGGGVGEPLAIQELGNAAPTSFSQDGTMLLMTVDSRSPERREDIMLHRLGHSGPPEIILGTGANESDAMFSPDGKHFAHISNEPGRYEVFVRAFPDTGRKWQISTSGGSSPRWSKDGKRLFFLDGQDFMTAVTIETDNGFSVSPPQRLFDVKTVATTELQGEGAYDVLPDGSFVMVQPAEWEKQPARIQVVLNWSAELK